MAPYQAGRNILMWVSMAINGFLFLLRLVLPADENTVVTAIVYLQLAGAQLRFCCVFAV
jgi:hypothetical protein